jgi:hypothetical protein
MRFTVRLPNEKTPAAVMSVISDLQGWNSQQINLGGTDIPELITLSKFHNVKAWCAH